MSLEKPIGPEAILEKKKKYIMPCLAHFYKEPRQFVKGEMQYLFDSEGRKYLDCFAGVSVINCGHSSVLLVLRLMREPCCWLPYILARMNLLLCGTVCTVVPN